VQEVQLKRTSQIY